MKIEPFFYFLVGVTILLQKKGDERARSKNFESSMQKGKNTYTRLHVVQIHTFISYSFFRVIVFLLNNVKVDVLVSSIVDIDVLMFHFFHIMY